MRLGYPYLWLAAGWLAGRSFVTVVVTGSSGFIGSHLCASLRALGKPTVGVDRVPSPAGATIQTDLAAALPAFIDVVPANTEEVSATRADTTRCAELLGITFATDLRALVNRQVAATAPAPSSRLQEVR